MKSLKLHIDNILQIEKVLAYIETLPFQQVETQKLDARLVCKQEEIERYQQLKVTLYESLKDGILDKNEYLEMKTLYDNKLLEAQKAGSVLTQERERILQNQTTELLWIERFKAYQNIDHLERRIIVTLIERIEVYEDRRIEIRFQYQNEYDQALKFIQNIEKTISLAPYTIEKEAV